MDETNANEPTTEGQSEAPAGDDSSTLSRIVELNCDVTEARQKWERLHQQAKAAKEVLEECQDALNDYINEIGREYPLFDGSRKDAPPGDDEAWRSAEIEALGLSSALADKLFDEGLLTVGHLCDYRQGQDSRGFTGIKGVGEAAATKIEDALEAFFAPRRPAGTLNINADLAAGVREAEQARGGKKGGDEDEPEGATQSWRDEPLEKLTFLEPTTLAVLREHDVRFVGQLVGLRASGDDCPRFLDRRQIADVDDTLIRFKFSLSDRVIDEINRALASAPPWPSPAADAWRPAPIGELGLISLTVAALDRHDVLTVGELVAIGGGEVPWLTPDHREDVADCLDRFRGRLSNEQIADFDAARNGEPAPEPKATPKRRRKAVGA